MYDEGVPFPETSRPERTPRKRHPVAYIGTAALSLCLINGIHLSNMFHSGNVGERCRIILLTVPPGNEVDISLNPYTNVEVTNSPGGSLDVSTEDTNTQVDTIIGTLGLTGQRIAIQNPLGHLAGSLTSVVVTYLTPSSKGINVSVESYCTSND